MPELPEVQTIVNELSEALIGKTILDCQILRTSIIQGNTKAFLKNIKNSTIEKICRKGKYIIITFTNSYCLITHLKMTGKFIVQNNSSRNHKHDRVIFHIKNGQKLIFNDMRCFGKMELVRDITEHVGIRNLGWDPWDKDLTYKNFLKKIATRKTSIKAILMDQKIIAGLGNIYVSEILYKVGLHPLKKPNSITPKQASLIIDSTKKILAQALHCNGTSISDYRRVDEKQGEFQNFLKVYGKEGQPCVKCASLIKRIVQQQRSSFFCPKCQK